MKPRVLLLAPKREYLNPTIAVFMKGLSECTNVTMHGPGYGSELHDLHTLKRLHGPFDVLAIDLSLIHI